MADTKPTSLDIRAENGRLVGRDTAGTDWIIRWCGNGSGSHWVLYRLGEEMSKGWYVFAYHRYCDVDPLVIQIRAAEHKYRIYS